MFDRFYRLDRSRTTTGSGLGLALVKAIASLHGLTLSAGRPQSGPGGHPHAMSAPSWLWIPLTLFAAAAQTVRNTAQRRLVDELGTLGATLVRFLYGMPLLALWLRRPPRAARFRGCRD